MNTRENAASWTCVDRPAQTRAHAPNANLRAALRLHAYLSSPAHWDGANLRGPDVGIRFNSRIGRFVKSYLRRVSWHDNYSYIQAQGYWILGNWGMFSLFPEEKYQQLATRCSEYVVSQQRDDGAWLYPNPEWSGRIATAEGTWGSLGLIETYRRTGNRKFVTAVEKWHEFLVRKIGFQTVGAELAVNYFQGRKGPRIPNNSAILLRFLAELADVTGQHAYLKPCDGLLRFLKAVQTPSGEFPYAVPGESDGGSCRHFQCYQYNAFACLDLMRYHELTGDSSVLPAVSALLDFLQQAQSPDGHSFFACGDHHREVTYHTAVLARAFAAAGPFGIQGYAANARRAYDYLLKLQRLDGSFGFSRGDYFLLHDARSYPRNLAMILFHLLPDSQAAEPQSIPKQPLT